MLTITTPLQAPSVPDPPVLLVPPDRGERYPRWAVAAAIAALPLLTPQGPANTAPVDGFILIAIVTTLLWAGPSRQPLRFPYALGIGTMVIAGCVAALLGNFPHAGLLAIVIDIFLFAWVTTVVNVGRTAAAAGFLLRVWCVTGTIWGLAFVAFITSSLGASSSASGYSARVGFTLGETNGAGLYFALTILVILAGRWPRRLWWRVPVIACLLYDLLLTGSLAGIGGFLAGVALALVVRTAVWRGGAAALILLVILAVAGGSLYEVAHRDQVVEKAQSSQNHLVRNSIGRAQQSAWEREMITQETLHLRATSSVLGLGPNATKNTLEREQAPYPKEAHDDWTAAVVERGILGLAGLLMLVGEIVVRASRVGSHRRLGPGLSAALPAPEFLVGALATLALYSFTHQILHDRNVWTLLGLLAAFSLWRSPAVPDGSPVPSLTANGVLPSANGVLR
jgi:O-antigen ligase/polysaccharide polymerase Wzy-like membrane protein